MALDAGRAGSGDPGAGRASVLPDEIEALIAIGEVDAARSILEPFAVQAEALGRSGHSPPPNEDGALLHASKGDLPAALAAFERAVEAHATSTSPSSWAGPSSPRARRSVA